MAEIAHKTYRIGQFDLLLPLDHMLPTYRARWKLYKKQIGIIARYIAAKYPDLRLIHVGANIGDTLAEIQSHIQAPALCIEGNRNFLQFLQQNIDALNGHIDIANCFVGLEQCVDSVGRESSGAAVAVRSLRAILAEHSHFQGSKFIKIDIDGFDFITQCALSVIATDKPVLMFEYDTKLPENAAQGIQAIQALMKTNYRNYLLFDNFGNYFCSHTSGDILFFHELNAYLKSNRDHGTAVYYFDVVAFHEEDADLFTKIRQHYLQQDAPSDNQRIAIDGVFFQLFKTGIARVWMELLQIWAMDGFGKQLLLLDRAKTAPRIEGIEYLDIPAYDYTHTDADRQMLQQICNAHHISQFVSSYYTTPLTTPTVFFAYDMIPEVFGWDPSQPMLREKHYGIRHAQRFISISKNTAKDLCRFFPEIRPEQIRVAHCGVSLQSSSAKEIADFRNRHVIQRPYFLLTGTRSGYKNALLFFKAFAQYGSERQDYAIVCTGPWKTLEQEFVPYVGDAEIHLLDLSDSELQSAYSGAIALAYPSLYEGFGMPVIEAMACGCPVITCPTGSLPEVADNAAIYVAPSSPEELFKALEAVQEPKNRAELIARGRERAQGFSWKKMAAEVQQYLCQR